VSPFSVGVIGIVVLVIFFLGGVPIAFSMALVGLFGFIYLVGLGPGLSIMASDIFTQFSSFTLSVIPMCILMGSFAFASRISRRLFDTCYTILGQLRGGLAYASIAASMAFGAICGSTAATCGTIGKIALPEMRRHKYDDTLATGCIASSGGLGILIPPSTGFIVYGLLTQQSIAELFMAGIIPGVILTILFMAIIALLCKRNPALASAGVRTTWKEKGGSLMGVSETLILFLLSIGGLLLGWFTPTQAGAIGAAGCLVIGRARGHLHWLGFIEATKDGLRISCMILMLIAGAIIFGHFMAVTGITTTLVNWVRAVPMPSWTVFALLCITWSIFGCFVDAMAVLVLLIPLIYPVVVELGFDPIWFGVIVVLLSIVAVVTPPVGVNLFVVKGISQNVPLETIYKGVLPFLSALLAVLVIVSVFPQVATFLPNLVSY